MQKQEIAALHLPEEIILPSEMLQLLQIRLSATRYILGQPLGDGERDIPIELSELIDMIAGFMQNPEQEFPINTKYVRNTIPEYIFRLSTMREPDDTLVSSRVVFPVLSPEMFLSLVGRTLEESTFQKAVSITDGQNLLKSTITMIDTFVEDGRSPT